MHYRWLKSKELPLIQILVGCNAALSHPLHRYFLNDYTDIIEMAAFPKRQYRYFAINSTDIFENSIVAGLFANTDDQKMRADTSDSLAHVRERNWFSLYSTLLFFERHKIPQEISLGWIQKLECLYMKGFIRPTEPTRKRHQGEYCNVIAPTKRLLGRWRINPLKHPKRDYVVVSYTWEPALGEETATGRYYVETRGKGRPVPSKLRDVVLDRVTKYAEYSKCRCFWIDQECIDQKDPQEQSLAIQSMDLVYSLSNYPVAILSIRIDSSEDLSTLAELLRGTFVREKKETPFLELSSDIGPKTRKALKLLDTITSDIWWTRGWTFQEDYRSSTKMTLLIPHRRSLETQKQNARDLFGVLRSELCVNSADFREEATRFCIAYQNQRERGEQDKLISENILRRAGKYTVLLRNTPENTNNTVCKSMSPVIFADIGSRGITRCSDRLAIAANCCSYSVRLDADKLKIKGCSLSIAMLALYLLNGEIIVNNGDDKDGDTAAPFTDGIFDFLKKRSLNTFQPPIDKRLTFIKSCRFINVRFSKEGIRTEGHIWKLSKSIDVEFLPRLPSEHGSPNGLSGYQRRRLRQLATELASGRQGKHYRALAKHLNRYLGEDAQLSEKYKPSFSKRFKDWMAGELVKAMCSRSKTLRLASIVNGLSNEAYRPYSGVFIGDAAKSVTERYVFTSSCPGEGDFSAPGKHVSLEVDLRGPTRGGLPQLITKTWINGLYFFEGCPRRDVVFPWPASWAI